jgi:hypothetical protein
MTRCSIRFCLICFCVFCVFTSLCFVCRKKIKKKELSLCFFPRMFGCFFSSSFQPAPSSATQTVTVRRPICPSSFFPYFVVVVVVVCVIIRWCIATKMFVFYGVAGGEGGSHQTYLLESCLASSVYLRNLE